MSYFKDWFGRSEKDGYTKYDTKKRSIRWEDGYDNYSDFLFGNNYGFRSSKMQVQEAADLLNTMSKVVDIDQEKFAAKKDQSKIFIPIKMLTEQNKSTDVFLGACLQNISHDKHQTKEEKLHAAKAKVPSVKNLTFSILNSERVNNFMSEDTPGYLKFVQKYKKDKYDKRVKIEPTEDNKGKRLLELFDRIIRFPADIEDEELTEFAEPVEKIKEAIAKYDGIPSKFKECLSLTDTITGIIKKFIKDENEENEGEGDDEGGGGGASGEDGAPGRKPYNPDKDGDITSTIQSLMDSMSEPDDDVTTKNQAEFQDLLKKIETSNDLSSGKVKNVQFVIPDLDSSAQNSYKGYLGRIDRTKASVIATLLKRKNRDYQFNLKSMKSGKLDTNKLAEASQGVPTIYERMGTVKTNKLSVTILIDESGSMSGTCIDKAKEAAIFLNEALKKVPDVELFIYGHTADYPGMIGTTRCNGINSTQIIVYKEHNKLNDYIMGNIKARNENRDGVAMIAVAKRVREITKNNGVFIVISDGAPSAHEYRGETATKHVCHMANAIEKMGFQVMQVAIGGYSSHGMFKHVINMERMDTFPQQFTAFLKQKIDVMIKERVVM